MASEKSLEKAAQLWCLPQHSNKIMDAEFAKSIATALDEARIEAIEDLKDIDIEPICEAVHKAYCKYHIEHKGVAYWTNGDYSKLNEEGKEYDRRTVRAVIDAIRKLKEKP